MTDIIIVQGDDNKIVHCSFGWNGGKHWTITARQQNGEVAVSLNYKTSTDETIVSYPLFFGEWIDEIEWQWGYWDDGDGWAYYPAVGIKNRYPTLEDMPAYIQNAVRSKAHLLPAG